MQTSLLGKMLSVKPTPTEPEILLGVIVALALDNYGDFVFLVIGPTGYMERQCPVYLMMFSDPPKIWPPNATAAPASGSDSSTAGSPTSPTTPPST